jgi:integrase
VNPGQQPSERYPPPLLYDTGLRRSELVALDCGMLDLEAGHLTVPGAIQKDYPNDNSPSDVRMQLASEDDLRTVRTLRAYLGGREDGAVFPSQKANRITPKSVNDIVSRLAERADVRPHHFTGRGEAADLTPHTFRHSVAYRFLHEYDGYTLYNVSQRLRHSRLATTEENYAHFDTV